ncbi:MAG: urease accessory protein UreD [Ilumatobacter sp.]|uniref:urease accessory protein UreD n=1 Tax=Ilumatobacter sp. TaxID=1967498 RepID=UPI003299CB3F
MKGHGSIRVAYDERSGRSSLSSAASGPPFGIRSCAGRILIAASAAAPVGGDELSLDVAVDDGACADVGTVASTVVLPGPTGEPSTMSTRCRVGRDAHLDWIGEPTVSVVGSTHTVTTAVTLDASATCRIVEEVSLGRTREDSGLLRLVLRVERDGRPLVHHDESFGPRVRGAGSSVSVGAARHVLSAILVGVGAGPARSFVCDSVRVAWLPVSDDAAVVFAVGTDRPGVVDAVSRLAPELTARRD